MRVESAVEHLAADLVGIFEGVFVRRHGADGADDALSDAGDDGFFGGAADELFEVGADGYARFDEQADTVFSHGVEEGGSLFRIRAVDDLRVDAGRNGVENIAAGEVDGGSLLETQLDVGLVGGDERLHHVNDIASGEVMRFEQVAADINPGFDGLNTGAGDQRYRHFAQDFHPDQVVEFDRRAGPPGLYPDREHGENNRREDKADDQ